MVVPEQPVLYSVDLVGCSALSDLSPDVLSDAFVQALETAGATVVERVAHHIPGRA